MDSIVKVINLKQVEQIIFVIVTALNPKWMGIILNKRKKENSKKGRNILGDILIYLYFIYIKLLYEDD